MSPCSSRAVWNSLARRRDCFPAVMRDWANVVFACALLAMRRLPLGLIQWMVFVSGLLDVILLSALTVLTLDPQSYLYWLFLALIVRSAVSVPRATSQLVLHFTIIICCVITGVIQVSITTSLYEKFRAERAVQRVYNSSRPARQTVPQGSNATFSVVASGVDPLGYQWQLNGTNIPGA